MRYATRFEPICGFIIWLLSCADSFNVLHPATREAALSASAAKETESPSALLFKLQNETAGRAPDGALQRTAARRGQAPPRTWVPEWIPDHVNNPAPPPTITHASHNSSRYTITYCPSYQLKTKHIHISLTVWHESNFGTICVAQQGLRNHQAQIWEHPVQHTRNEPRTYTRVCKMYQEDSSK